MTRDDLIATIEEAIDNVHDMGVTSRDYAVSVADALGPLLDAADEMTSCLHQYRSDMMYVPAPDSRQRRIARIDEALSTYRAAKEALQ